MQFFTPLAVTITLLFFGAQAKAVQGPSTTCTQKLLLKWASSSCTTPTQQDYLHEAFQQRFPEINFTLVVDYSKYHDVRIDNQLETDSLVPDVVALQTLQDFPCWATEG